jgi:4-hydroxymandelate synthase
MKIEGLDHIEFYVDDAAQAAEDLCAGFGFQIHGRGGPETGLDGFQSVLTRQNDITILFTSATDPAHRAAEYIGRHDDGPAVIAFKVADAHACFAEAVQNGATPVSPPTGQDVVFASVNGFGDVEHRFVSRRRGRVPFAPGLVREEVPAASTGPRLARVDHVAVCLEANSLAPAVEAYKTIFGFTRSFEERIVVGDQAMNSIVVRSPDSSVTFTLLEPDPTLERGQIDDFLDRHGGAGVQHIAFSTSDITTAVRRCIDRGIRFLATPASYYDGLGSRLGSGLPVPALRELSILADKDHWGLMFQIFTESQHPRGTFFYELIERRGARSFGTRNIKALYEAVERQRAAELDRRS